MNDAMHRPRSSRFVATGLVILVLALNVAFLAYFAKKRSDTGSAVGAENIPIKDVLAKPLTNSLPDVSPFEQDFRAKISLEPLCKGHPKKIRYSCDTRASFHVVQDGNLVGLGPFRDFVKPQHLVKELVFEAGESPEAVHFLEQIGPADGTRVHADMPAEVKAVRVLNADGRYTEAPSNVLKKHYREIDPKFLPTDVSKGTKWAQRIAVDPGLNPPDGVVLADIEVLNTFARKGQRFARIRRTFAFRAHRPALQANGMPSSSEETKDIIRVRIDELTDLNLATAIYEDRNTVTQMYFDGVRRDALDKNDLLDQLAKADANGGLLVESRASETLVAVEYEGGKPVKH